MTQTRNDHNHPGLHPTAGARFLFEHRSESEDHQSAVYRAAIYTPDQCFEYEAELHLDGEYRVAPKSDPATDELESKLARIAKLIARSATTKLADELPPWPHRVLRWRGPGRG